VNSPLHSSQLVAIAEACRILTIAPDDAKVSDIFVALHEMTGCPLGELDADAQIFVRALVTESVSRVCARLGASANDSLSIGVIRMASTISEPAQWHAELNAISTDYAGRARATGPRVVQIALKMIDEHYADPDLTLTDLGRHLQMSPWHTSRVLSLHTGVGFRGHLRTRRMGEAQRLLRERRLSVKEISARVGFHSPSTFCRQFKAVTGRTPTFQKTLSSEPR
jgi:AraC-like DNA-binding protein